MIYLLISMKTSSTSSTTAAAHPAKGRPRSFDPAQALDRAMRVFWSKGYEGTSLSDLTAAMGINRPSLYAAFGNKESLFRRALQQYGEGSLTLLQPALARPTARAVAETMLHSIVNLLTDPTTPGGCLWVRGALSCGECSDLLQQELAAMRGFMEQQIVARLERAITEGDLPSSADPRALAKYLATVNYGLAIQSSAGATRKELLAIVETALAAWPA